jgi:hypothetical protein
VVDLPEMGGRVLALGTTRVAILQEYRRATG